MTTVFAIAGPLGSGKSTLGNYLFERLSKIHSDSLNLPFAKKVKDIAYSMGWNGEKDEKGRRLLQLIGTEAGRQCISETIWAEHWLGVVQLVNPRFVVVDDLRFENEISFLEQLDRVVIIKIKGRNEIEVTSETHASEIGIDDKLVNEIYFNNRRLEHIEAFADHLIWQYTNGNWPGDHSV